jgi:hypothetical protein
MAKSPKKKKDLSINHRFLDEAGDSTFYGKGKTNIIGHEGVSNCFILGMVKFREPLEPLRERIKELQLLVANDPYYQVPSILKKVSNQGYYFHATDDLPEVRKLFFDFIKNVRCSFEAVVGRKSIEFYETRHKGRQEYFYADLLSHLLKNKLSKDKKLIIHISEKGKSTKHNNLNLALAKAAQRHMGTAGKEEKPILAKVVFDVNFPTAEPLLNVADYFCWAVQRVFEKGETRYYDFVKDQVSLVVDLYDQEKWENWKNYYNSMNPLTVKNKISPQVH